MERDLERSDCDNAHTERSCVESVCREATRRESSIEVPPSTQDRLKELEATSLEVAREADPCIPTDTLVLMIGDSPETKSRHYPPSKELCQFLTLGHEVHDADAQRAKAIRRRVFWTEFVFCFHDSFDCGRVRIIRNSGGTTIPILTRVETSSTRR